jgi:hypothetical protein
LKCVIVLILLSLCGSVAYAQSALPTAFGTPAARTSYPGQAWLEEGNYSPSEASVLTTGYVEQGVTIGHVFGLSLAPFGSFGISADTKGYDWENRSAIRAGAKVSKVFSHGIVEVSTGYSLEDRFKSGLQRGGLTSYADYWFGWSNIGGGGRFPGSSYGLVGNVSPVEHNNMLSALHVEQGVVAKRFGKIAVVPFGETTVSRDTAGFQWNNRNIGGAGLNVVIPTPHAQFQLGGDYLNEVRFNGLSAAGYGLFLKFWSGWGRR